MNTLSKLNPFRSWFSLLCLCSVVSFCALGVWQLHRYQFKQTLFLAYQNHQTIVPLTEAPLPFQQIKVRGEYQNGLTMLLQNKFNQGQVGVEVLTPLKIPGQKKLLLIDRGWVAQHSELLGHLGSGKGEQEIIGQVKFLNEYQFTLGKNILQPNTFPLVMQKIDIQEISQLTHAVYFPFIIQLHASAPNGFARNWVITTVPPERHLGYALQWFLMAVALTLAYAIAMLKQP